MKTTPFCVLLAFALALLTSPAGAAQYFNDNFDSYTSEAEFAAAGWVSTHVDGWTTVTTPPGPGCYEIYDPPGTYGHQLSTTDWLVMDTYYTTQKLISIGPPPVYQTVYSYNSIANPPTRNGQPTTGNHPLSNSDWGPLSDIPDSGASHDMITPEFSTLGAANPYFHASVLAVENNNYAKAVFMIDASTDGGTTWNNLWLRAGVGRRVAAGGGGTGGGICTTYLEDHTNCGSYYGVLDLDLASVANQASVKLRFRQYEPNDDWWFSVDDVVVDDNPGPQAGPNEIFSEKFSNAGAPTMGAMTLSGGAWNNSPGASYQPADLPLNDLINRIGHPDMNPTFAVTQGTTDAWMMTPVLDCSDMTKVSLAFDDEMRCTTSGSLQEVLVMQDSDGDGVAESTDTVLGTVFKYQTGAWQRGNEDAYYQSRIMEVAEAAGLDNVFFAWHNTSGSAETKYFWAVDNIEVTGVPEPSTIALLIGAALMGLGRLSPSWLNLDAC